MSKPTIYDRVAVIEEWMAQERITRGWAQYPHVEGLPCNLEAEKSILGAVLLDNAAYSKDVLPEDFSLDSNQRIYRKMIELLEAGKPVDIVTLTESFGAKNAEIGGITYLASLTEGLPRWPVVKEYVAILKEKAKLRQIIRACEAAIAKAAEQSTTASEIVEQLGKDLKGIRKGKA